ncbi:MAG TPA: KH domain-containing protein [Patescibacteria group bacterium]|nr:KH domain-containing protein [Patescibacteria group bacterium]
MKKTIEYILSAIVEKGDKIEVDEQEQNGIINFTIKVDKDDMGKVIGKNGRVIRSIRNVMKIPAIKQDKKIYINLLEN